MKSPQVKLYCADPENYSDLKVLSSNAGYYIGTVYTSPEGFNEPGSRDSHYFPDKASATLYLEQVESSENPIPLLRMCP